MMYEKRSFSCGTGVPPGALLDLSISHSVQPVGVFSLDINSVSSLKLLALDADKSLM